MYTVMYNGDDDDARWIIGWMTIDGNLLPLYDLLAAFPDVNPEWIMDMPQTVEPVHIRGLLARHRQDDADDPNA